MSDAQQNTKGKGKQLTLRVKVIASVGAVLAAVVDNLFGLDIGAGYIIQIWLFVAGLFLPIDLSLIAKNVFGRR